ncbi:hypothetical protein [Thalassotalea litorea]|uniref:hypothetical protein n=1 Tax=Thalassotalea litorea TaxID=2020715 RepID=UPI00373549AC
MSDITKPIALSIYANLFRNPAAIIFLILFMLIYTIIFSVAISDKNVDILELVKAAPFAVSAAVLGIFSIIFWALNYIGKTQKVELTIKEAEALFRIRKRLIDEVFDEPSPEPTVELAALKAHLLLAGGELNAEPETPSTKLGFEYSDAVKALLKRS